MPIGLTILSLFALGFILIIIEVVIIPGIGLAGILGTVSIVAGCYTAFTSFSPLIGGIFSLLSIIFVFALFKILPKTRMWQQVRLNLTQKKSMGYQVAPEGFKKLVEKTGTSLTILRPSGTALIENTRYDVVADSDFIEKDKNIKVCKVEGIKIVVREINP